MTTSNFKVEKETRIHANSSVLNLTACIGKKCLLRVKKTCMEILETQCRVCTCMYVTNATFPAQF